MRRKRGILCVILLLVMFSAFQAWAAEPKKGVLRMSGDNTWEAYANGKKIGSGVDWQQVGAYEFDLVNGSAVIAIHVHDAEPAAAGVGGMLADIVLDDDTYFGTGINEGEWKASADDSFLDDDEWIEPNFDDSGWEEPVVYDQFGAGVWAGGTAIMQGVLQEPDCTAFWIWAGPNNAADEVFFRFTIGENVAVEPQSKVTTTWGQIKAVY